MRGQNKPRKAHWKKKIPQGERELFEIDQDTIHNILGRESFFLSLFKMHALNVKAGPTELLSGLLQQQDKAFKGSVFLYTQFKDSLSDYDVR